MVRGRLGVGHVLAPWPFLLFGAIAIVGGTAGCPILGLAHGVMLAFDLAAVAFTLSCIPLFGHQVQQMREAALRNDANRGVMLLIATAVSVVIMVAVASELAHKGRPKPLEITLVIATLCLCWAFSTLVYTLHYAHLFYTRGAEGKDGGGICFPQTDEPNYWDFAYFSSCLAMTFQTSDVDVTSGVFRRTVMFHCLGAFVFNLGVIAFSINILGGS